MADPQLPLLRGPLDVLVLRALSWGPMHGFEVTTWLEARSAQMLEIVDSALYQALGRLEARGLIEGEWGTTENNRRARYYELTAAGRRQLAAEVSHWERLSDAVNLVLRTAE